jgi:hypothetical protein
MTRRLTMSDSGKKRGRKTQAEAPAAPVKKARYIVLTHNGLSAVLDNQFERVHDGWWGDGNKGIAIAEKRCIKANERDVSTGLSAAVRAKNTEAGLQQFVNAA